jgi:MFS family permease
VTDETGTKVPPGNATLPIEDQQKGPPMPGRRIRQRLGRRGTFLAILGTGKTCWGVSFLADPPNDHGLQLLTEVCGLRHWSWLWIVCGLVTFTSAFLKIGRDWFGFLTAFIPPTVWAIAYTYAVIAGDYSRGAYVAIWYLTSHVGVIWWASTVPEHSVPPTPRLPRRGKAA